MDKKYSLFPQPLMQEGSFCFVDYYYRHTYGDAWLVGSKSWELVYTSKEEDIIYTILGIERKIKENVFFFAHQTMMHDNSDFYDMDNIIETPDLYYEKTLDGPIKYLSEHLYKYCIVRDKNISRFIKIVDRTPAGIYYKNLQESEYIERIDSRDFEKRINLSKKVIIEIVEETANDIYFLTYTPIGRIHKAPYKKYYADMIKEILKYDEEKQKEKSLTLSLQWKDVPHLFFLQIQNSRKRVVLHAKIIDKK